MRFRALIIAFVCLSATIGHAYGQEDSVEEDDDGGSEDEEPSMWLSSYASAGDDALTPNDITSTGRQEEQAGTSHTQSVERPLSDARSSGDGLVADGSAAASASGASVTATDTDKALLRDRVLASLHSLHVPHDHNKDAPLLSSGSGARASAPPGPQALGATQSYSRSSGRSALGGGGTASLESAEAVGGDSKASSSPPVFSESVAAGGGASASTSESAPSVSAKHNSKDSGADGTAVSTRSDSSSVWSASRSSSSSSPSGAQAPPSLHSDSASSASSPSSSAGSGAVDPPASHPPPPSPPLKEDRETKALELVKKDVDTAASFERQELRQVQKQVNALDSALKTKVDLLEKNLVQQAGGGGGRGEWSRTNTTQTLQFVKAVKQTIQAIAGTMNGTIKTTLNTLQERTSVIKQLIQREEDAHRMREVKRQRGQLAVDYESGLVKTGNGSLLRSVDQIIHAGSESEPALRDTKNDPAVLQEDFIFLKDFVTLLVAATLGGLVAAYLRSPVFVGFIVGGMVVGPSGLSLLKRLRYVETLSQVGGPLLLFVQGLSLQSTAIAPLSRRFLWGLAAQMGATCVAMVCLLWAGNFAHTYGEALLLGLCTSVSSSAVSLKIAEDNGHSRTVYYKVLISMAMIQDFVMALLLCLPAAIHHGYMGIFVVAQQMVYVMILVSSAVIAAVKVMPRVVQYFVHQSNPELFLLSIVSLCLGAASFTRWIGLSTEFGAFFAGLVLTRTALVKEALYRIDPLKDVFCALFFASIGLVISTRFIWNNMQTIIFLFSAIFALKFITTYLLLHVNGQPKKTAMFTALTLGEVGEFSIFVAGNGYTMGILSRKCYLLFLAVTVFSLVATPVLFKSILLLSQVKPTPLRNVIALNELGDIEMTRRGSFSLKGRNNKLPVL